MTTAEFLTSQTEMGARIRELDWSATPLGPQENWSQALRIVVGLMLANRFPMLLWWGPEYISLYNDAYIPILGQKHPWALGQPVRECWSEIWDILKPLIDTPFRGGPATWSEDLEVNLKRSGYLEETHFTIAYSPVPDESCEGGIGGVLATVTETTGQVIGQRRMTLLRDLGAALTGSRTQAEVCTRAATLLAGRRKDILSASLYMADENSSTAKWIASTEPDRGLLEWPTDVAKEAVTVVERPEGAMAVVPIWGQGTHGYRGVMTVGLNPLLPFDEGYENFLTLTAAQIAGAVASAREYEEERKRAAALAEIDQQKTAFFSNISHEFRTPLTLMLGPLENVLDEQSLTEEARDQLTAARRNSLRLLKLVNTLLNFSRIEAGRMEASYGPTDLCEFTVDLASHFRSAMQAAGLEFDVQCEDLREPVYVDSEMWEQIVVNLLSNAFKFTLSGKVSLQLGAQDGWAELRVTDTGTGIPEHELPRIFQRFHRVDGVRGRTFEGSGIGLALVQELVRFHGGSIEVESREGEGSTFTVRVPFGSAHLPAERVRSTPRPRQETTRQASLIEANAWLERGSDPIRARETRDGVAHIVVVDDNADMREHLKRILGGGYDVRAFSDGRSAFEAILKNPPDLVLSDVMMPDMNGFELLSALREHKDLRETAIILISARAGEEARTEGISAGADDYITKPFSAKELRARVETMLKLQSVRREARLQLERSASEVERRRAALEESEARFRNMANYAPVMVWVSDPEGRSTFLSESWYAFTGQTAEEALGFGWVNALHPGDRATAQQVFVDATADRAPFRIEYRLRRADGEYRWCIDAAAPRLGDDGKFLGYIGSVLDVTDRKESEEALRRSEERFRLATETGRVGIWDMDIEEDSVRLTESLHALTGLAEENFGGTRDAFLDLVCPEDRAAVAEALERSVTEDAPFRLSFRTTRPTGKTIWLYANAVVLRNDGRAVRMLGAVVDVTELKRVEQALVTANQDLEQFAYSASHDLREPLRTVKIFTEMLQSRYRDRLDGPGLEFLDHIAEGAERMEALVRGLLDYNQVGLKDKPAHLESAAEAFGIAVLNLHAAVAEHGAEIDCGDLPEVPVHAAHLQQLFQNLIGNALKYRRKDVRPRIRICAERDHQQWRFAVADNGIGIQPEYKNLIFGLFKRLHATDEYAGTGIGLALCQRIVERYHGRIWVESRCDEGSTFYFTLPSGDRRHRA